MLRPVAPRPLLLVLVACALAGCGDSGSSDEEQVRAAVAGSLDAGEIWDEDALDADELAETVLTLVRDADLAPGDEPWLGALALPDEDGEQAPAGELVLPGSPFAQVMREGRVQAVVVGADRIAANGDTANKIGTYQVALAAAAHGIPFYVAAPSSTFDLSLASGEAIPIEQRPPEEVTHGFGRATAPAGIKVYNPAFDVTPARLIAAIICEHGLIRPVTPERIAEALGEPAQP